MTAILRRKPREETFEHSAMSSPALYPISRAQAGSSVRLVKTLAGRRLKHRLAELGLTPGVTLRVVQDNGGPLLISVRGSRVAVGRGVAHHLLVTPVTETS